MVPITLDSITKTYGPSTNISMDTVIEAGHMFTLLGPSGCGKSTLLRMIAGFVKPTSGKVLFGNNNVTYKAPNERDTGMVFQNYALFPHMTVYENVAYGLKARGVAKNKQSERVNRALNQVGLEGYQNRRIDQLSGGQQQRVALARAVVIEPSVLLLDEPLSNLDAQLRDETRAEIRRVQTEAGITSIYVTHDQAEALAMSDMIAVLEAGRVHQIAPPETIYHHPATEFVARFIGRSNVVPAEVRSVDAGEACVALEDGTTFSAPRPEIFTIQQGDRLSVSLRPENLGFVQSDKALFKGSVINVEFTGSSIIYKIRTNPHVLHVTVPHQRDLPNLGDVVHVGMTSGHPWLVMK